MFLQALALGLVFLTAVGIPKGFQPLFPKKGLTGWHISEVNHHGNTKAWKNEGGLVTVTQDKPGNGGILLTDKQYANFELSLELKPDWGCDGGIFLRSTEKGEAYQVMVDYLEGGSVGGIYGEKIPEINAAGNGTGTRINKDWMQYWKKDDWNHLRIRIEGETPHIQVWMNGTKITDWTDSANHAKTGGAKGMIALQTHRTNPEATKGRWVPGGIHRYRNVAVRELP
jgi:hypothetical protein